ncbi:MAG: ATPase domain-containing protein [Candidatus Nanohaloarchaea archaeon]|nr:ATPase domain-containing protein [Candidatus Nanohaloarchaea archaeon]
MAERERVKTGVEGLDELLQGGIPRHNTVLLAGPSGSGKTTISIEFLYRGITEHDENGLYISFEENKEELLENLPFDWDIEGLTEDGSLNIVKYDPYQYEDVIDLIRSNIKQNDAKRVVVDSITALSLYVEDVKDVRKLILDMNEELKKENATTIYTGEIRTGHPEEISRFGVEEFIADGVIRLLLGEKSGGSELTNQILVRKMRGTDHDKKFHPFDIEEDGVKVYSEETAISSGGGGGGGGGGSEELF